MSDRVTDVVIPDFSAIERRLLGLEGNAGRRIINNAIAAGARVARNQARSTRVFQDRTRRLRTGIVVRRHRGRVLLRADAPHAHLVELGHGGPHPAPPHPFLVPAVEETRDRQLKAAAKATVGGLKRYLERGGR